MLVRRVPYIAFTYAGAKVSLGTTSADILPMSCFVETFSSLLLWLNYRNNKQRFSGFYQELKTQSMGLKMFVRQNLFYLDVGYSHYCLFRVPMSLHLICRKKRVYFASINILYRHSLHFIDRIKKFSVYKSKGLMFASRLKYMQMRIGKKQTI